MIAVANAATPISAAMDVTLKSTASPVLPVGLELIACPVLDPSLLADAEAVEVFLLDDALVEAAVGAAIIAAAVDLATVGFPPVIKEKRGLHLLVVTLSARHGQPTTCLGFLPDIALIFNLR